MKDEINKKEMTVLISKKIVSIGLKAKNRRLELNLTQFNLAVDSDCSMSVISKLDRGIASGITLGTLMKIAFALDMTVDELFCD